LRDRVVAVGHRVVHGGPNLYRPTMVDDSVLDELERDSAFAPLHNPPALQAMRAARRLLDRAPHVAVFDTGFHRNLPPVARTYAIPADLAARWAIRRYGAHGISCEYLAERLAVLDPGRRRAILCHLGAGSSLTAIQDGRSVDTSMGLTPLEGLVMATRSGDLDPAIVLYLQEQAGLTTKEVALILERESGLKGLSGTTGDFRAVQDRVAAGDAAARLAFDLFAYRVRKYVGAYWAALTGLDAIVFAGGIGENSPTLRSAVVDPLSALGLHLDPNANVVGAPERRISRADASVSIWVIPTRETLVIARHALAFA
jgi:acetate kinase